MLQVLLFSLLSQFSVEEKPLPQPVFTVEVKSLPSTILQENKPGKLVVIQFSKLSCGPCKQAKAVIAEAKNLGYEVKEQILAESDPTPVPLFRWDTPNGPMQLTGWYGLDHLTKEWTRTTAKKQVVRQQTNSYSPRWTYPAPLSNHLQSVHGINTSGMSQDDMERAHDAAHESTRRVRK